MKILLCPHCRGRLFVEEGCGWSITTCINCGYEEESGSAPKLYSSSLDFDNYLPGQLRLSGAVPQRHRANLGD